MDETLSPKHRERVPIATVSRLQSPTSPFFLGSNNDQLERAQARAARAAAFRRKSFTANALPRYFGDDTDSDGCLNKQQILDLFQNCIKLASENKINQKNMWELNLIDHLTDIIKVEEETETETNFQKASCTLEAGVKIYSLRVDSVHSEAYKVLGGMNRVGQESDVSAEDAAVNSVQQTVSRKEMDKKISPSTTLESSFEALNVKKFDAAFAVDPFYHQTSAQFDEGGAKGLLMNNLGVYGGCRLLFDSLEIPTKCMDYENRQDALEKIDLSFAREYIERMVLHAQKENEISPTLKSIVNLFNEDNRRPTYHQSSGESSDEKLEEVCETHEETRFEGDGGGGYPTWNDDDIDCASVDVCSDGADSSFLSYPQENDQYASNDPDLDDRFDNIDEYLLFSLGFAANRNAWAGPEHWKFQKSKSLNAQSKTEDASSITTKRSRKVEVELEFTKAMEKAISDPFAPPKNSKSLLLPERRPPCNTRLPEDCHYQPEDLVKLFHLPTLKCLGKKRRKFSEQCNDEESFPAWDNGSNYGAEDDYGDVHGDTEDSSTLVSQPRQINKIEVQYDKTAKQVDVQALKLTLWDKLQESAQSPVQGQEQTISFRQILSTFPSECGAAATTDDISPHLCFICLLHLANEHVLSLDSNANLDDLSISFPRTDRDL